MDPEFIQDEDLANDMAMEAENIAAFNKLRDAYDIDTEILAKSIPKVPFALMRFFQMGRALN